MFFLGSGRCSKTWIKVITSKGAGDLIGIIAFGHHGQAILHPREFKVTGAEINGGHIQTGLAGKTGELSTSGTELQKSLSGRHI